jgi:hypothetical protein
VLVRVGHFARGPVIVIAKVLEMGADPVLHLEGVQRRIEAEEAAVAGGDVQADIAFINGAEQAAEVELGGGRAIADPDRVPWFLSGVAQGYPCIADSGATTPAAAALESSKSKFSRQ